jgi:hypothetical protein
MIYLQNIKESFDTKNITSEFRSPFRGHLDHIPFSGFMSIRTHITITIWKSIRNNQNVPK